MPTTLPPRSGLRPRLWADVRVLAGEETTELSSPHGRLVLRRPSAGQTALVRALADGRHTEAELGAAIHAADGPGGAAWHYLLLARLAERGMLGYELTVGDRPYVRLQPFSPHYRATLLPLPPDRPVQLCRFAYVRRLDASLVLESPRAHARVFLDAPEAAALLARLATPHCPADPGLDDLAGGLAEPLLQLLFRHAFLTDAAGDATPPEAREDGPADARADAQAEAQAEAQWEFHDLLFHGRSRAGRSLYPWGATYRWAGAHQPLPAVKIQTGPGVPLERPDVKRLQEADPPFAAVLEARRSRRLPGPAPLTRAQLAEFLFRTARVRGRTFTDHEEVSNRPYPGGGADYELEIYPVVHRVDALPPGVYHYDPLGHVLHSVAEAGPQSQLLLREAAQKARLPVLPDVLLCMTARFQRLTFKYSSIAYAVMLKDLGALYQTFYLAATAMGLAPCAIGSGDAERFAAVTGLPALVEPSVGEFMLSSLNPEEGDGPHLPAVPEGA